MSASPYFDSAYFDSAYFDTDTPGGRGAGRAIEPNPLAVQLVEDDEHLLALD